MVVTRKLFINLPVSNLRRSQAFYEALGFQSDPGFCDETAVGMRIDDTLFLMLLTPTKFADFAPAPQTDTKATTAVLNCLSCENREEVDDLTQRAASLGGLTDWRAPQDYGFMYGRGVQDPDGHVWEFMWMDEAAMAAQSQSVE